MSCPFVQSRFDDKTKSYPLPLLCILYTSEMFELVENRLLGYGDGSTLLSVVHMPEDRPTVAASLNPAYITIFLHAYTSGYGKAPQQ